MTRSFHSRKGFCHCWMCRYSDRSERARKRVRSKHSTKTKILKFYDLFLSQKTPKQDLPARTKKAINLNYLDVMFSAQINSARRSYRTWDWLKGKPNSKGWIPSRYVQEFENGFRRIYSPKI